MDAVQGPAEEKKKEDAEEKKAEPIDEQAQE